MRWLLAKNQGSPDSQCNRMLLHILTSTIAVQQKVEPVPLSTLTKVKTMNPHNVLRFRAGTRHKTAKSLFITILVSVSWLLISTPSESSAATIVNGSFESGFSGWIPGDIASPHISLAVRPNGFNSGFGFFTSSATDAAMVASHGFDGGGPGTISFAQDIGVVDASSAMLRFDYRAGWDMLNYGGSTQPRVFSIVVRPAGGGASLASYEVLRANAGTRVLDTGSILAEINLGAHINSNVRISFEAFIPQSFTGPAFLQVDRVALSAIPEPATAILVMIGTASLLMRRRGHLAIRSALSLSQQV